MGITGRSLWKDSKGAGWSHSLASKDLLALHAERADVQPCNAREKIYAHQSGEHKGAGWCHALASQDLLGEDDSDFEMSTVPAEVRLALADPGSRTAGLSLEAPSPQTGMPMWMRQGGRGLC